MVGQVLCGRFLRCKRRVSRRSDAGFFAKLIGVNFNAPLTSRNIFSRRGAAAYNVGTKGAGEGFCVFVNDERLGPHAGSLD